MPKPCSSGFNKEMGHIIILFIDVLSVFVERQETRCYKVLLVYTCFYLISTENKVKALFECLNNNQVKSHLSGKCLIVPVIDG